MARIGVALLAVLLLAGGVMADGGVRDVPSDQIAAAIALADSEPVELTGVFVEYVIFPYVFVSDPCRRDSPWSVLPVYAPSFILNEHFSLNITGVMATVENNRIVIAEDVGIYTDSALEWNPLNGHLVS